MPTDVAPQAVNAAAIRALFPGLEDTTCLNTATMNVGCAPDDQVAELLSPFLSVRV
jgi:hypothetical protein